MVVRYRGVRPNSNNNNNININNYAALAEGSQPSTLHKLRQLRLYTNTDTPVTVHQLDVEAVAAEVTYTTTNTQSSYSGGGELGCIPTTFKEAMGLPQAARWKTLSDKEIASLEKHGVFKLVPIPSGKKGSITISQKDYTDAAMQRYAMEDCSSAYTPGVGPKLSLNQLEEKLLNEEEKWHYQWIAGAVMHLA